MLHRVEQGIMAYPCEKAQDDFQRQPQATRASCVRIHPLQAHNEQPQGSSSRFHYGGVQYCTM